MQEIIKIKEMSLPRLNNAEYTHFLGGVQNLVTAATPASLGISNELFSAFTESVRQLTEIGNQSRISDETADLEILDKQRDAQAVYILNTIRNERKAPAEARQKAAASLYNLLKPFVGMQNLPNRQETQTVEDFMADIDTPENAANILALNLQDAVADLRAKNLQYKDLTMNRAESQMVKFVDNSKKIRAVADRQYEEIEIRAFAESVAKPTAVTKDFITKLNKLKADTKAAYNLRSSSRPPQNAKSV